MALTIITKGQAPSLMAVALVLCNLRVGVKWRCVLLCEVMKLSYKTPKYNNHRETLNQTYYLMGKVSP